MKTPVKEINFIPDFVIKENQNKARLIMVAVGTVVFTLMAFAVYFIPEVRLSILSIQNENMNTEMKFLEDVKEIKNKLENLEARVDKKKKALEDISRNEVDVVLLMEKLTAAAPQNVSLTFFSVSGPENINVQYIINNPVEASNLVDNLRKLDIFERVEMPSIPIVDRRTDVKFNLKLKSGALSTQGIEK